MTGPRPGAAFAGLFLLMLAAAPSAAADSATFGAVEPKACIADYLDNFGRSSYHSFRPAALKRFPSLESLTPIPGFVDPFDWDSIPLRCLFYASKSRSPVHKAKGRFTLELIVLDHSSHRFQRFDVDAGSFKTGDDGYGRFEAEVDLRPYADGFPSSVLSAWFLTRADFTRKKGTYASASCSFSAALSASEPIPRRIGKSSGYLDHYGGCSFRVESTCPLRQFPVFESAVPIPSTIDLAESDKVGVECAAGAFAAGQPAYRAKGSYLAELYLLDDTSGTFEVLSVDSGKLKIGSDGYGKYSFEIDAELFADGFESGDLLAWSYTRTLFDTKKARYAEAGCDIVDY